MVKKNGLNNEKKAKLINVDKEKISKTTSVSNKVLNYERVLFDDLIVNSRNFYAITDIESLSESILTNGLNSPLTVRSLPDLNYEIICGHRRYYAIKKLLDENLIKNRLVDVVIVDVNDDDAMLRLIEDNALTRELSDFEKLQEVQYLKEIYEKKKKEGSKIPGRVLDLIAKDKNVARSKLVRYDAINRRLIKELYEKIKDNRLNLSCAYEICTMEDNHQMKILELFNSDENTITMNQIIDLKNKLNSDNKSEAKIDSFVKINSSNHSTPSDKTEQKLSTIRRVSTTVSRNADSVRKHLVRFKKSKTSLDNDTYKQLEATLEVINSLRVVIEEYINND